MIRYPLYKGGFILLPQQVVKALYILDKSKELSINEQLDLLTQGVKYDAEDTELNKIRQIFMELNGIKEPNNVEQILDFLINCSLIHVVEGSYKIDYFHSIEFTRFTLKKDMIYLLNDVRQVLKSSEEMTSYFNTLDLTNLKLASTSDRNIILANQLMLEAEPNELLKRTSFVYELSDLKKRVKEVEHVKENH